MAESLSYPSLAEAVVHIAINASQAIMCVYDRVNDESSQSLAVNFKADDSPVTEADVAAHQVLMRGLRELSDDNPILDIPILSEEGVIPPFSERQHWQRYWLIDPLDGTKEFIKRNGEFTVNVALIDNGYPVLGVIVVPATGVAYWGAQGCGAHTIHAPDIRAPDIHALSYSSGSDEVRIHTQAIAAVEKPECVRVVASRQYGSETMDVIESLLYERFNAIEYQAMGSSLKFCLIAEGKADFYPRLALTSEWDTAAAQAIVEAAGGCVLDAELRPLRYNTKESLLNPYFYVIGDTKYDWKGILSQIVLE